MTHDLKSAIQAAIVLARQANTKDYPSYNGEPLVLSRLQEALGSLPQTETNDSVSEPEVEEKETDKIEVEKSEPEKKPNALHSLFHHKQKKAS